MKSFNGEILFLDRSDINTDEIIPAKYLTELTKAALKPYLLEDLHLEGFSPKEDIPRKKAIVTRSNIGCGSSREHAVWALEMNNINIVIAESFARIFRQNMLNCGMLPVELDKQHIEEIFNTFGKDTATVDTDLGKLTLTISGSSNKKTYSFSLTDFEKNLIKAGGWIEYADLHY